MFKTAKSSPYFLPTIMLLLCIFFYGYQYLLQVSPSVMAQDLMRDFKVNATALGNLAACYFYAYAGMQIPVGVIMDRFGARRPLNIAVFLCALGCFLFAATQYFSITLIGRLLIGLGASFAVVGTLYITASWLSLRIFTLIIGITVTIGMIGASSGQAPLAMMVDNFGWRNTMFIFAAIGFIIFFMMWLFIRDLPKINRLKSTTPPQQKTTLLFGIKQIIKNRQIWLLAIYGGLMFMPMSVIGALWGTPFLMHKYNLDNTVAGSIMMMLFFGLAVGSPLFGWFTDRVGHRKTVMLISSCGALISVVAIIYPQLPIPITSTALFFFGFFIGGSLACFTIAREIDTTQSTGAAMGFMNMLNMTGGAIAQPLVGFFLDWRWQGLMDQGVRVYYTADFKIALSVLPIGIICSILILPFINEPRHITNK